MSLKQIIENQAVDPPTAITITNPPEDILIRFADCKYYTEDEQPSYDVETEKLERIITVDGDTAHGTWNVQPLGRR